jgi:hypothetical protein
MKRLCLFFFLKPIEYVIYSTISLIIEVYTLVSYIGINYFVRTEAFVTKGAIHFASICVKVGFQFTQLSDTPFGYVSK